ncbi:amidohydrolase [Microbacterium sp. MPKO10]|uniref:amidohydrolase family protein n=1 Tax=Microbacterium sp. MPKO10 TaxID=2989818 RepID=UPI0022365300|nr:amidohydrolase family protein [Microbacterium sp. MPKO10]MCW4457114.1 amidohydrolase family protein [Microbacterium sp. MPKO10]
MDIIDSHLHVWDRSRARYDWLGPHVADVDRDITFDEVVPELDRAGVDGVILVQSADERGDTENMLDVASREERVVGVVGWVPLDDAPRATELLDRFGSEKIVGVRNLIHDRSDPDWVLSSPVDEGLTVLERERLPFDFVTGDPAALTRLMIAADRHPDLPIVLDHLGKPTIDGAEAERAEWRRLLALVAERPNVFAKVSGLYAASGKADSWTTPQVGSAARVACDLFGAERLMYGGDWPMSTMAGGYERVFAALQAATADWSQFERENYFARTARAVYRLPGP